MIGRGKGDRGDERSVERGYVKICLLCPICLQLFLCLPVVLALRWVYAMVVVLEVFSHASVGCWL